MSRLILALALSAVALPQDMAPGAPRLEFKAQGVGDKSEIRIESTFELDVVSSSVQDPDANITKQLSYVRTQEFTQTVQDVQNGAVKSFKISCSTAKLQRSGTNLAPVTETSEIEGKDFVVTRGEKGRTVRFDNGDSAPADADGLGAWEDVAKLLPTGDAKEGATWTTDAAGLAGLISIPDLPTPTGSFEVKLEKLAEGQAVLAFTGTLEGKTVKGFDAKVKVAEGKLVVDTAKGRPVTLTVSGSLEASKDITQKVAKSNELRQTDEKVGNVKVTSRKLEVKIEFR
ncbi:MAG TPA: hypothetical protein VJU16_02460 [Planctomycetota bacterium]|nr:hypothetical protein [Planctomycetota bacterium]